MCMSHGEYKSNPSLVVTSPFQEASVYVEDLIKPVIPSFTDQDSRVRYYACESLYNICKVCRGFVLPYFNHIFDGVSKVK